MDTPLFDGELVHARRMIYTPSAFAKSNLVHLQEVGQLQARSPHASTRQGLASYLFFVVESGSGTLEYEGETRVLCAGDCVFLDCRRPYRHYTGDDLWQLRWAHFYGPNMAAIYKKYRERGGQPSFHPENTAPYTRRLEALYTLAASDNYVRDMQICEGLFALLTLLMQESWHPEIVRTAGTKRQNVQEIKDYLDLHFAEKITLDALASLASLAREHGVPVASHDDDTVEKLELMQQLGCTISEFPISLEVAAEARRRGMSTVMGTPNILLGKSHSGNLSASEAVRGGVASCLCSDYYPTAMLQSAFVLHHTFKLPLEEAFAMLTINPARAVAADDQIGSLEEGKKADVLVVREVEEGQHSYPVITMAMVDGRVVSRTWYPSLPSMSARFATDAATVEETLVDEGVRA